MAWHKLTIEQNEGVVAAMSGTALIEKLCKAYRDAGVPEGVEAYHLTSHSARHVFIFSTAAFALLPTATLQGFGKIEAFDKKPQVEGFNKIPL